MMRASEGQLYLKLYSQFLLTLRASFKFLFYVLTDSEASEF